MRNKKTETEFIPLPETSEILIKASYSFDQGGLDFRVFTGLTSKGAGFLESEIRALQKKAHRTGLCGKRRVFEPFKIKTENGRFIMYSVMIVACKDINAFNEAMKKEETE